MKMGRGNTEKKMETMRNEENRERKHRRKDENGERMMRWGYLGPMCC